MKRIIQEYTPPSPEQAGIFHMPPSAIAIQYNGKLYIDYLTDSDQLPISPFYVGEKLADDTVIDKVGDASNFPHNFAGWDRGYVPPEKPVIELSANIAKIMLLRAGYLDAIKTIVYSLGEEAIINFEQAPYIHSDHPLVFAVLSSLGLSPDAIYQLFIDASLI